MEGQSKGQIGQQVLSPKHNIQLQTDFIHKKWKRWKREMRGTPTNTHYVNTIYIITQTRYNARKARCKICSSKIRKHVAQGC